MVSSKGLSLRWLGGERSMGKIKCISKIQCPSCGLSALCQVFLRKDGSIRYARFRHYTGSKNGKPCFEYHAVTDLEALKTLLKSQSISLSIGKADGSLGQNQSGNMHDLELKDSSPVQQNACGRRLVWFRTQAFQACDPGFESRRPHQLNSLLFELTLFT